MLIITPVLLIGVGKAFGSGHAILAPSISERRSYDDIHVS